MTKDRRIERELKKWSSLTPQRIQSQRKDAERQLKDDVAEGALDLALYTLVDVAQASLWQGQRAIARGDASGWIDVLDYSYTCVEAFLRGGIKSSVSAGRFAPALLLRLAHEGWSNDLKEARTALDGALKKIKGSERSEISVAYYASFIAELMATRRGKPDGPKGPLARVAEQATAKLSPAVLEGACEFQLENLGSTEDDGVEFVDYKLMPVWWFALARAREGLKLETQAPEHPLFSTAFAALPSAVKYNPKQSALLKRVEAVAKGKLK